MSLAPRAALATATAPLAAPSEAGVRTLVRVELGERGYDVVIGRGALHELGARAASLSPSVSARAVVVTDENVAGLALEDALSALRSAGFEAASVVVPPGEGSKSFRELERVTDAALAARLDRAGLVVALGGGVVGDLAGFAAAIALRGVRVVQVPTTLLAQVDSSVGGKTGINVARGKNLVGAFHQPALVLADTALLDALPLRELRAGYAEVVKTALIDDAPFFERLERNRAAIFAGGPERDEAIAACCRSKAAIVARDETETGDRALLNLGHTFAHALERAVGYDSTRLVHGEAVAIGLAQAYRFSARLGLCSGQDAVRVSSHLAAAGLPTTLQAVPGGAGSAEALLDAMGRDKKASGGRLTFILAREIGSAFVARDVDPAAVLGFLREEGAA